MEWGDGTRVTTVHDRYMLVVVFDDGGRDGATDMNAMGKEEALGRAKRLSSRSCYKAVEVYDRMARRGATQLWIFENGELVKTEVR